TGLRSNPAKCERPLPVLPKDRAMAREFQFDFDRRLPFHRYGFVLNGDTHPSIRRLVLQRILRIEVLKIQILLIDAEDCESPRDVLIVAQSNSWQPRFARANHIPPRCDQMDDIAQRWQSNYSMRIIGQDRLASRCQLSRDRPVITAL